MKEIYLDNNATTRVDDAVFEEMRPYFCELYGNPSSMHFFGGQVQKKVDEARARVAALLGAQPDEVVFTACGTRERQHRHPLRPGGLPGEAARYYHPGRAPGGSDVVPAIWSRRGTG